VDRSNRAGGRGRLERGRLERNDGFTLLELMIVLAIIGILASIAIPNFLRFQARAKQAEVKGNLKAIFTAQKAYRAEAAGYSSRFTDIGFAPERGNRYAYYLGGDHLELRDGAAPAMPAGGADSISVDTMRFGGGPTPVFEGTLVGTLGGQSDTFTATAAARLDGDPGVDSWQISNVSTAHTARCGDTSEVYSAGVPFNEYDDTRCE
jgi:type IV pilus assembly protein PilA